MSALAVCRDVAYCTVQARGEIITRARANLTGNSMTKVADVGRTLAVQETSNLLQCCFGAATTPSLIGTHGCAVAGLLKGRSLPGRAPPTRDVDARRYHCSQPGLSMYVEASLSLSPHPFSQTGRRTEGSLSMIKFNKSLICSHFLARYKNPGSVKKSCVAATIKNRG